MFDELTEEVRKLLEEQLKKLEGKEKVHYLDSLMSRISLLRNMALDDLVASKK
jgi:hypothetical protein